MRTAVDISKLRISAIPAGGGVPQASAAKALSPGYVEKEYLVSGVAATYTGKATGPATVASTGMPYTTRALVRMPSDASRFSGRVFVEPFNTSASVDADVVWAEIAPMLEQNGDAWIGVTVRTSSVVPLQKFDPVRYAALKLPSNDIEWDILRQLGGLLKQGGAPSPLAGDTVKRLYMGAYSQSGIDVATFASAFNSRTRMSDGSSVYDGYLPAAHSGSMSPLQSGTSALPKFEATSIGAVDVPVVDVETQTDVEGFRANINATLVYTSIGEAGLRRADSNTAKDRYRLYELAGAPHADTIPGCDGPASTFPTNYFLQGAVSLLYRWAEDGAAPPTAPPMKLKSLGVVSVVALDSVGNALGGLRSPTLDVPLARYQAHSTPGAICELAGRTTPLPTAALAGRYGSSAAYLQKYTQSLDASIKAGFLRQADRQALLTATTTQAKKLFVS